MTELPQPVLPQRIDLTRETDVAYWCQIFGLSIDQLRAAVQHAGPDPREVRRHLSEKPAQRR